MSINKIDNQWAVTGWNESKGATVNYAVCIPLNAKQKPPRDQPQCFNTPGVSMELHRIDDTRIELIAKGLDPEGVLYIFYGSPAGRDFRGEVSIYQGKGGI